ncbi:MAG: NB-ARC domain-containing protein, partial [Chloroflexota bacterium]|nr:NB-ARC domain-containing protein [Chloroflexota bacterium]
GTAASQLPVPLTSFIGREQEVAEVVRLLASTRLLTLTGPGGVGKTRLGVHIATMLLGAGVDEVRFVALAPISDSALVIPTIAQTLGVRERSGQPLLATLQGALRDRSLLLVLDNVEQVLDAAVQIADLLQAAPALKVLVTSRAPLHLAGEQQYAVPPLTLPDPQAMEAVAQVTRSEAGALFVARARAVKHDFALTPANAAAIATICRRLDGLPLAIELAAARSKLLPPGDLLAHLGQRLPLLTGGSRDLPARQQTIRNTIDWSYQLLGAHEQRVFRRLGVFVGGFTLTAAEAVCQDGKGQETAPAREDEPVDRLTILEGLHVLVDQSLVKHEERGLGAGDSAARFRMLELVREYAYEQLAASGEAEAVRAKHAAYYLALGERAEPQLRGSEQATWLARLELEHNNVRSALQWSLDAAAADRQAGELGVRLATAVWEFWSRQGYVREGRRWLEVLRPWLPADPVDDETRRLRARALSAAGNLTVYDNDAAAAQPLLMESLALFEELGDTWSIAYVRQNLGINAFFRDDTERATVLWEQSLALFRQVGDPWGIGWGLLYLGNFLGATADAPDVLKRRRALAEESLAHFRAAGDSFAITCSQRILASIAAHQGDYHHARVLLTENLTVYGSLGIGNRAGMVWALMGFAELMALQGQRHEQLERAVRLYGAAEAIDQRMGIDELTGPWAGAHQPRIALLRATLGEARFTTAWVEGRAMAPEQAITHALDSDDQSHPPFDA